MLNAILSFLFGKHQTIFVSKDLDAQVVAGRTAQGLYIVQTPVVCRRVRTRSTRESVNLFLADHFGGLPIRAKYQGFVMVSFDGSTVRAMPKIASDNVPVTKETYLAIEKMFLAEYLDGIKPKIVG